MASIIDLNSMNSSLPKLPSAPLRWTVPLPIELKACLILYVWRSLFSPYHMFNLISTGFQCLFSERLDLTSKSGFLNEVKKPKIAAKYKIKRELNKKKGKHQDCWREKPGSNNKKRQNRGNKRDSHKMPDSGA